MKSNIAGITLTIIPSMSTDFEAEAEQSPAPSGSMIISTPRIKQGVSDRLSQVTIFLLRFHTNSTAATSSSIMSTNGTLSKPEFPANAASKEYAASLDAADPLASFREKFIIPSKANIASTKLAKPGNMFIPQIAAHRR